MDKNQTGHLFFTALMHQSNNVDSRRCYQCVKFLVTLAQKWVHLFYSSLGFTTIEVIDELWLWFILLCFFFLSLTTEFWVCFYFSPPGVHQPRITLKTCLVTGAGQYSGYRKRQAYTIYRVARELETPLNKMQYDSSTQRDEQKYSLSDNFTKTGTHTAKLLYCIALGCLGVPNQLATESIRTSVLYRSGVTADSVCSYSLHICFLKRLYALYSATWQLQIQ